MEEAKKWWLDSHKKSKPNRSQWLQSTLAELDEKTEIMLKLIEEDADSFAQRAEMYYKRRPELVNMLKDFYRSHRSLAERYDLVKSESRSRLPTPCASPVSFTKATREQGTETFTLLSARLFDLKNCRLEKSLLSSLDKAYDSYSETYEPEEYDDSEVDNPEEVEIVQDHDKTKSEQVSSGPVNEELMKLKEEMEELREENEIQKEQLMQKDEEKREVIRQLSLAMDLLREENVKLRNHVTKNTCKKKSSYGGLTEELVQWISKITG
ncbi:Protein NETWORKED 3A [Forsythia ovata]|uniref:Protein NETWORKED 3A n=1 Tax=Forsythia ovata TaxID=205694 RepID=A0ABD1X711_9LAMI